MTHEMLESIRKKAEAFPVLAIEREEPYTPPGVPVTPVEDFMLAKVGQSYPRGGGSFYLGGIEASFSKAEAEFVAEARGNILALIEENFALRAALAGAENSIQAHNEHEKRLLFEASELAQEAYRRGAEAMREAAARYFDATPCVTTTVQGAIRALPIPEDKA